MYWYKFWNPTISLKMFIKFYGRQVHIGGREVYCYDKLHAGLKCGKIVRNNF